MKNYKFWKENKVSQEYELPLDELKQKFSEFVNNKSLSLREYYGCRQSVLLFITDKEDGLNSVFENDRADEIVKDLSDIFYSSFAS